ncbi:MAG: PHP domain-containing protein [Patescibacteria group bacterium]
METRKFDLHLHSRYSIDAFSSLPALFKKAKMKNLGLAIADHNVIGGSLKASQQQEVIIIPAIETLTYEGVHTLFYFEQADQLDKFFHDVIKPKQDPQLLIKIGLLELIKQAPRHQCLVGWPHPFVLNRGGCYKLVKRNKMTENELMDLVDFIEVINGAASATQNQAAAELAVKYHKAPVGGSDAHLLSEVGTVYTEIAANSTKEVLEAIAARHTKAGGQPRGRFACLGASIIKETKTILRPGGHKILMDQIRRVGK